MRRIVVHAEWRPEIDPDVSLEERESQWFEMVFPLFERAIALGGRLIGWGPRSLVVDFSWDGLYDAVDYLVDAPLAPELAAGLAHGDVEVVHDAGRMAFVLGVPVRTAFDLARLARPGEVLIAPQMASEAEGRLGTAGEVGKRPGRPEVPALILDPERPLRETQLPSAPSLRGVPESQPATRRAYSSSPAPESERVRQVDRLAHATAALGDAAPAVFSEELQVALSTRDAASLERLAKGVRDHPSPEAANRLHAIAQLAGGKSGEALRRLRRAKEQAPPDDPSAQCRASLALGVALASAGRAYEAALAGLEGLARAREGDDERGERACARFLAQISRSLQDEKSAEAWQMLGA